MPEWVQSATRWILLLVGFGRLEPAPLVAEVPGPDPEPLPEIKNAPPAVEPAPVPLAVASDHAAEASAMGRWYFRETILDDLARYFTMLRKMRKIDSDAYGYFSRVGGVLHNYSAHGNDEEMLYTGDLSWDLPKIGALVWCDKETGDSIPPAYVYFHELVRLPFNIERASGRTFAITIVWWSRKKELEKYPVGGKAYLELSDDLKAARVLKELRSNRQVIRHRDGYAKHGGGRETLVYHTGWAVPGWCTRFAEEKSGSVDDVIGRVFRLSANALMNAQMDLRVRAEKNGLVGAFCVDMLRTPYFFRDRDTTILVNGRRKPIFHIVRSHERVLSDGRKTGVKSHTRGLRRFDWNGYKINITLPGLHHGTIYDGGPAAHEFDESERIPDDARPVATLGRMLDKHVNV